VNGVRRSVWLRLLGALAGLGLLLWLIHLTRRVLTPFAAAFALAYFLNPVANALERGWARVLGGRRLVRWLRPRVAAVGCLVAGVVLIVGSAVVLLAPVVAEQVSETVAKLPGYIKAVRAELEPLYQRLNVRFPEQTEQIRHQIEEALRDSLPQLLAPVGRLVRDAFSSAFSFLLAVLNLVVIPVFTVYLLYDMNHIREGAGELVPPRFRDYVFSRGHRVERLLAAFVRGQVTVCLILGSFYALALTVIGVPMGVPVGLLIGFFNLIPFLSFALGLPLALLLSWIDLPDPNRLLVVAGVFALGQVVEGNVITPRIVGERLGLHAVVIMLAVLIGGSLFGFIGMLLAVPVTASLSVFWSDLRELYLRSAFYRGSETADPR
jgi:predicted PurR-regulated permease PerM